MHTVMAKLHAKLRKANAALHEEPAALPRTIREPGLPYLCPFNHLGLHCAAFEHSACHGKAVLIVMRLLLCLNCS